MGFCLLDNLCLFQGIAIADTVLETDWAVRSIFKAILIGDPRGSPSLCKTSTWFPEPETGFAGVERVILVYVAAIIVHYQT